MELFDYGLYFGLSLILSTLFAMGGVGSAIALVPTFSALEMPINLAKALGLFVNTSSTITASLLSWRRGTLEIGFALPLVLSILMATPVGAWSSQFVPRAGVEALLVGFLVIGAFLLLVTGRRTLITSQARWPLVAIGATVGVISGMLGVGGGTLIMPALILLGHDAKRAARAVSFVIPFSSAAAFLTYLSFTPMNWPLLGVVAVAAVAGGALGERILHYRLEARQIRKLIAVLLLGLAAKLAWGLIASPVPVLPG